MRVPSVFTRLPRGRYSRYKIGLFSRCLGLGKAEAMVGGLLDTNSERLTPSINVLGA